jgi:hypothetical protein
MVSAQATRAVPGSPKRGQRAAERNSKPDSQCDIVQRDSHPRTESNARGQPKARILQLKAAGFVVRFSFHNASGFERFAEIFQNLGIHRSGRHPTGQSGRHVFGGP